MNPSRQPPGSILAIEAGCRCPMRENNHGAGISFDQGWGYFVNAECPIHAPGLNLAQNGQLAQGSNADSVIEPNGQNHCNYVD